MAPRRLLLDQRYRHGAAPNVTTVPEGFAIALIERSRRRMKGVPRRRCRAVEDDEAVRETGEQFPSCSVLLVFTRCLPIAHIQARRPEEHFPRAFVSSSLPWWAKAVSNHRPPACKLWPDLLVDFRIFQNGSYIHVVRTLHVSACSRPL